ncbi:PAS fold-containing protein [Nocardioides scoriae]|uniref:histidine kinase n=1 Tax=Nocardioides scoriae TaxID=642780 RepID=A0A1H1LI95_9ACTN|nr:ATP-binding protein [Nocardioides scoriae]SDR74311.1 PAS fold-containing protein [Nocardioides scoriae]
MGPSPHRDAPDLDSVLDAVPMLVVVIDRETQHVVRMNRIALHTLECTPEQVIGVRWQELVDEQTAPVMHAAMSGERSTMGLESTITSGSGHPRRVLWSVGRALESTAMTADHVVLTGLDVTPTGPPQGLFSHVVKGKSTPMIVGTDLAGRVTLFNSTAEHVLGRSACDMVGRALPAELFEQAEIAERAHRLGVPADLTLLTRDLSGLDRRRSDVDLGPLDRRQRRGGGPQDRRGGGPGDRRDRRSGSADDRRSGGAQDRRGSGAQPRDWTLIRSDGARLTASVSITRVAGDSTDHVGYLAIAEDVTEQRRTRNLLIAGLEKEAEAVRRLRELDRARTDFVATVSHELRTPITSILGYVEVLLDAVADQPPSVHHDMLEAVRRNGERMHSLAENLLTLSSFEAGEFSMKVTSLDLRTVVERAEQALRPFIDERRLTTSFELPSHPVPVQGDLAHLERVLLNLMSNALKFTEDGGRVTCRLSSCHGQAVLEVVDTGIGVPAAEQGQLFTRFFRSSTAEKRAIQGTGIGLNVVDAIVRRHGGVIEVDSEEGRGTSMLVRLPLHVTRDPDPVTTTDAPQQSAGVLVDS